jgi:putative transposase
VDRIDERMKEILFEKQQDFGYSIIEMEVRSDHVHLLLDVDPDVGVAVVIGKIKGFSSYTLRKEFPSLKKRLPCLWTRSKFISTVGAVSLEVVNKYIEEQKGV